MVSTRSTRSTVAASKADEKETTATSTRAIKTTKLKIPPPPEDADAARGKDAQRSPLNSPRPPPPADIPSKMKETQVLLSPRATRGGKAAATATAASPGSPGTAKILSSFPLPPDEEDVQPPAEQPPPVPTTSRKAALSAEPKKTPKKAAKGRSSSSSSGWSSLLSLAALSFVGAALFHAAALFLVCNSLPALAPQLPPQLLTQVLQPACALSGKAIAGARVRAAEAHLQLRSRAETVASALQTRMAQLNAGLPPRASEELVARVRLVLAQTRQRLEAVALHLAGMQAAESRTEQQKGPAVLHTWGLASGMLKAAVGSETFEMHAEAWHATVAAVRGLTYSC